MSIAVIGEALIDLIEGDDGAYRPHLGGSPFNFAIGLARQGMEVSYLSPLSEDGFGDQFARKLASEGVLCPNCARSSRPTSLALVTVDDLGMPTYSMYREGIADKDISFAQVCERLPDGLRLFHTGSLAITPSQLDKVTRLFEHLRSAGVVISIDINIRLGASADTEAYQQGVLSLLPYCDVVKASDEDLLSLGLGNDLEQVTLDVQQRLSECLLVLTEGQGGARLITPGGRISKPAYPIAQVVDTIGAGDTFHSAFIAGLVRADLLSQPLSEIPASALEPVLDHACAAAAINVSRHGCSPPRFDEVNKFAAAVVR